MTEAMLNSDLYDAIIVGSGAGGGMAAYNLTKAGAKCLMLEAGGWYDAARDSKWLEWVYDAPHRAGASATQPFGGFEAVVGGWEIAGEPYSNAPGKRLDVVPFPYAGRPHQRLGTHLPAQRPYDFKPTAATARASTGPSPMKTWPPITTRPKN